MYTYKYSGLIHVCRLCYSNSYNNLHCVTSLLSSTESASIGIGKSITSYQLVI